MPKAKNTLTPEQLSRMTAMMPALKEYSDFIGKSDLYYRGQNYWADHGQNDREFDLPVLLQEQIQAGEDMETPGQYEAWAKKQDELLRRLQELVDAIRKDIESEYRSEAGKNENRSMEEMLNAIAAKKANHQELSEAEQRITVGDDYNRLKEFGAKADTFAKAWDPAAEIRAVNEAPRAEQPAAPRQENAPRKDPEEEMADGLTAFAAELHRLESWGHHEQWKAMKEVLAQAQAIAAEITDDPAQKQSRMAAAMSLLQQTAMNYVLYKAVKNPSGKDLQRLQMAERMVGFAAQHVARLEPQVEQSDAADFISEDDYAARVGEGKGFVFKEENPLNRQMSRLRNLYHVLEEADRTSPANYAEYNILKEALEAFSDNNQMDNINLRHGIRRDGKDLWNERRQDLSQLISFADDCLRQQNTRHDYSPAAIRRLSAVTQVRDYLTHLQAAEQKALAAQQPQPEVKEEQPLQNEIHEEEQPPQNEVHEEEQPPQNVIHEEEQPPQNEIHEEPPKAPENPEAAKAFRKHVEESTAALKARVDKAPNELPEELKAAGSDVLYEAFVCYAYDVAKADCRTEMDRAVIEAVESGRGPALAKELQAGDLGSGRHYTYCVKDVDRYALGEYFRDGISADKFGEAYKELRPMPGDLKKRCIANFRDQAEKARQDLSDNVKNYPGEKFYRYGWNVTNCYRVYISELYEQAAARREKKEQPGPQDQKILELVESGRGILYANELQEQDKASVDSLTGEWFGEGYVTYETAKLLASKETAGIMLDKISRGIHPELSEEARTANVNALMKDAEDARSSLRDTLKKMYDTLSISQMTSLKFKNTDSGMIDACYRLYVTGCYLRASEHAKQEAATQEDLSLIRAVESGRAGAFIQQLKQEDKKDPSRITARWFGEGKITFRTVRSMLSEDTAKENVLEPIRRNEAPMSVEADNRELFWKSVEDDRRWLSKREKQRKGTYDLVVAKTAVKVASAYLYEAAKKNGGKTKWEQDLIRYVETGEFSEDMSYLDKLRKTGDQKAANVLLGYLGKENLSYEKIQLLCDREKAQAYCSEIADAYFQAEPVVAQQEPKPEAVAAQQEPPKVPVQNEEPAAAFRKHVEESIVLLSAEMKKHSKEYDVPADLKGPCLDLVYEGYVCYAYSVAKAGCRTDMDRAVIAAVESGKGPALAKELQEEDSITKKGINYHFSAKNLGQLQMEQFFRNGPSSNQFGRDYEELRLLPDSTAQRRITYFRKQVERDRVDLVFTVDNYKGKAFSSTGIGNINICYHIYVGELYEQTAARREKGEQLTPQDQEVLTAVESGRGIAYAEELKEKDKSSPDSLTGEWFGEGNLKYETAKAMSSKETAKTMLDKIRQGVHPELTDEMRADNIRNYQDLEEEARKELNDALRGMKEGARYTSEVKDADFKNTNPNVVLACYRLYVHDLYNRAVQRAKDGAPEAQDSALIQAVEAGKGEKFARHLMQEDEKNPGSLTAQWFGKGKISLKTAYGMTEESGEDSAEKILDAIHQKLTPAEANRKQLREKADSSREDILKNVASGHIHDNSNTNRCYTIYAAFLYEKAAANGGKTEEEKEIIRSVEQLGRVDVFANGAWAAKLKSDDKKNPKSITAQWFASDNLTKKTLNAMTDPEKRRELCEAIAAGKTPEEVFPPKKKVAKKTNAVKAEAPKKADEVIPAEKPEPKMELAARFLEYAQGERDNLNRIFCNKGQDPKAYMAEARQKGEDYSKQICAAFVGDVYESLPKQHRTQEQQLLAGLVESGKGMELVENLQNMPDMEAVLGFNAIKEADFKKALTKGGFADMAKNVAPLLAVRMEINLARGDKELKKAQDNEPTKENAARLSQLAYTVYAGMRYVAAKRMNVPTKGSKAIVDLVEKAGLQAYANGIKENDKNARGLFEPGNLTKKTVSMLYAGTGRKAFTKDITDGDITAKKPEAQKEPAKNTGMDMKK